MIQVAQFLPPNFETRYDKLVGPTGPCVYPALHVYIHSILFGITSYGTNIKLAQIIYAGLYLATLALVLATYRRVGAPPWLMVPLILSKRLHSIFLLRLFNDCWASFFLWAALYAIARGDWIVSPLAWTLGLGVKMTMFLPAPALAIMLVHHFGSEIAIFMGCASWVITFVTAIPFMGPNETFIYIKQAYNFGRVFIYKWSVNWKFVPEDLFLSKEFAYGLLALHITTLAIFAHGKWVRPSSNGLWDFLKKNYYFLQIEQHQQDEIARRATSKFAITSILGCNAIGFLFARSLHYQFYAYIGWATPYLLWSAGHNPVIVLAGSALQEYAWLVYPSEAWSSAVVVFMLAFQVGCAWAALPDSFPPLPPAKVEIVAEKKTE